MRVFQLQRISAVGLLVFLTMHMIVVHYPPFHIDFSRIAERMSQPLWQAIDIAFLFCVLVHALTGLYAVLMDWDVTARLKSVIVGAMIVAGTVAMWWGTLTVLSFGV